MRASVNQDDIGYTPKAYKYTAFLNGIKVNYCRTADEELGYILKFKEDKDGKLIIKDDELETEELYGEVEIRKVEKEDKDENKEE